MKFATKAIHAGISPDPLSGAIMTPVYQTSTYVQEAPGINKGYEYARTKNPTRSILEKNLAALENAEYGICFASGMAAVDAVMKLLSPGDHVLATNDIYGGTYRLFRQIFEGFGIRFDFVPMEDSSKIEAHIQENTRLIWVETPTNPLLRIIDIQAVCEIARKKDIPVCVDNTFASPYLQTPLDLGADLVLHSATKYLGGHSDLILGALVCRDKALADRLYFIQKSSGAVPGPQDCFLTLRGIKTLHVRLDRSCSNTEKIAEFLKSQKSIRNIYYPGFESHPNHHIAKSQMKAFGGMISFDLHNDSMEAANRVLTSTNIFSLAESLGGVESLISHPPSMTHASIPADVRKKAGLNDSLMRLSVGIEDVDDLIDDLRSALSNV